MIQCCMFLEFHWQSTLQIGPELIISLKVETAIHFLPIKRGNLVWYALKFPININEIVNFSVFVVHYSLRKIICFIIYH